MRTRAIAPLLTGLALLACRAGTGDQARGSAPADGCATPVLSAGAPIAGRLLVDGATRTYQLAVPVGDAHTARALVFVFHGSGGDGLGIRDYIGKAMEAAAGGKAIFVYPDGLKDGRASGWPNTGGRDVAFFDALLGKLAGQACLDRARVFVTGFSYGGNMSNTLGCARAGVVRAIAPLSGGGPWRACNGRALAAWVEHGNADPIVARSQGQASRDHWLGAAGCAATSSATPPSPHCSAYAGCGSNPVVWCTFDGGHEVPSWAPPAVWAFFDALP